LSGPRQSSCVLQPCTHMAVCPPKAPRPVPGGPMSLGGGGTHLASGRTAHFDVLPRQVMGKNRLDKLRQWPCMQVLCVMALGLDERSYGAQAAPVAHEGAQVWKPAKRGSIAAQSKQPPAVQPRLSVHSQPGEPGAHTGASISGNESDRQVSPGAHSLNGVPGVRSRAGVHTG